MSNNLRDRLAQAPWLPGSLPFLLKQDWADENYLQEALEDEIANIRKIPDDGTLGSLTKQEKRFLQNFGE